MELKFPKDFFWGAATSAHQVEGGDNNDWSVWEHANSARLAAEAASRHAKTPARIPDYILVRYPNPLQPENYISGRACDHYSLYEKDFDIAKQLGQNAHRFSIEWSRVEPEEGKFNEEEIEHYRKIVLALKARGLEPFVTLWHWTLPLWIRDIGGWGNKKTTEHFLRYASKIVGQLGREVKFWITLNETNVYTGLGYLLGVWPPQKKSLIQYLRANHHLSQAHIVVYEAIKKINPDASIGLAHNMVYFTGLAASIKKYIYNNLFLNSVGRHQDFVGVNYYHSSRNIKDRTDMNWPIDAEGFFSVLKDAARYKKPIFVLENGIVDAKDEKRAVFINDHISAMKKAMDEGVDVRGYFYWSLLDNFEWDKGFWPRFGLVGVDYKTMERRVRESAMEYARICKDNFLSL